MRSVNVSEVSVRKGESCYQWDFTIGSDRIGFYLLPEEHRLFLAGLRGQVNDREVVLGDLRNIVRHVTASGFEHVQLWSLFEEQANGATHQARCVWVYVPGLLLADSVGHKDAAYISPSMLAEWDAVISPRVHVHIPKDQREEWRRRSCPELRAHVRRLVGAVRRQAQGASLRASACVSGALHLSLDRWGGSYSGWGFSEAVGDREGLRGCIYYSNDGYSVHT